MESQTTETTTVTTDECGELTVTVSLKGLCGCNCGCGSQQPTDPCTDPTDPTDPDPVDPSGTITTTEESPWGLRETIVEADFETPWGAGLVVTPTQVFSISQDRANLQVRDKDYKLVNTFSLPVPAAPGNETAYALAWGGPDGNLFYFQEGRQVREIKTDGTDVGVVFDVPTATYGGYTVTDLAVDTNGDIYMAQGRAVGTTWVYKYIKSTNTLGTTPYAYTTATGAAHNAGVGGAVAIHPDTGNLWISTRHDSSTAYLTEFIPGADRATETLNKVQIGGAYASSTLSIVNSLFYASPVPAAYIHDVAVYGSGVHSVIMDNIGTLVSVGDTFVIHPQETTVTVKRIMNNNQVEVEEALTDATFEGSITVNA